MMSRGFTCQIQEMINEPAKKTKPKKKKTQRKFDHNTNKTSLRFPSNQQVTFTTECKEYKGVCINKCKLFALCVQFGRSWHSLRGLQLLSKPHVSVAVERVVSGWEVSTSSVAMNKTSFIILRGWNLLFDTKIVHSMTECYAFPYILSYMLAKVLKTRMSAHMKVIPVSHESGFKLLCMLQSSVFSTLGSV